MYNTITSSHSSYLESLYVNFRENVCEILFEEDNEEKSIATLIVDSILQVHIHGSGNSYLYN